MERELAQLIDDSVASVVPSRKAHNKIRSAREEVNNFPLPFVAPLGANDGICRHDSPLNRIWIDLRQKPTEVYQKGITDAKLL
jgi:hypothetical protein